VDILTFGIADQPIPQVIVKLDYQDVEDRADGGADVLSLGLGFIF
jgi:hypothetical protein